MTTTTERDGDDCNSGSRDSYVNQNSNMSGSEQMPSSRPILPGGPHGPDGTIIEEVMTAVVGKKQPVRGQAYRAQNGEYVSYYCTDDEVLYRPGDNVYIESQKADQPYFICSIQEFRRSKRYNLMVNIKWFYRPSEVPETVYQLLIQDRNSENNNKTLAIDQPEVKSRELFISDATDTYPVSVLRGTCKVEHYVDINAVREFQQELNAFFYILGYNPETRRLASTQGEIRIGPSHQAKLPEYRGCYNFQETFEDDDRWEEIHWISDKLPEDQVKMYVYAARSLAAFAGYCNSGCINSTNPASKDPTTIASLDILHEQNYDISKSLTALTKCPIPEALSIKWSEEDAKRFVKGLRMYGKNFFRIRKEYLTHKETSELVSYYYLWKKTAAAVGHRPHRRHRRQNILRRIRTPRGAARNTGPADPLDPSSASEREDDSDDSDSKDRQGYHCRHCYTTASRDWHHAGKGKQLLCYDCRMHFKHYGDLPVITHPREPPPPSATPRGPSQSAVEEEVGMRTRTRAKEISTRQRVSLRSRGNTPDITDDSDSLTPDRRTPDLNAAINNSSLCEKKTEEKVNKITILRRPEDETFVQFDSKNKKEDSNETSLYDESDDSGESLKSSEESKLTTIPSAFSSEDVQSCSVVLKTSSLLKSSQVISLSKSLDKENNNDNRSPPYITVDTSQKPINRSPKIEQGHSQTCDNTSESSRSVTSKVIAKPDNTFIENNSMGHDSNQDVINNMSKRTLSIDDTLPNESNSTNVNENTSDDKEIITKTVTPSTINFESNTVSTAITLFSPCMEVTNMSRESIIPSQMADRYDSHSPYAASNLSTSVINTSNVSGPCSLSSTHIRSHAPSSPPITSASFCNTMSVSSMLSQPSRISILPPNEMRNRANSPVYAPPPAHSSISATVPRAFSTVSPPPVAHPSSPQLPRSQPSGHMFHSALTFANSPLRVSSMISSYDEAKAGRLQSPKDPLPSVTGRSNSPLSDVSGTPKAPLRAPDTNFYPAGSNFSLNNAPQGMLPISSSNPCHLPNRSDKQNAATAPLPNPMYPLKLEADHIRHPPIGLHTQFGKRPFLGSPLTFPTSGMETMKSSPIPSPMSSAIGHREIYSPAQSSSLRPECYKKEVDYSKDKGKQNISGDFHRIEYKPDIVKREMVDFKPERYDVRQERYDRSEIKAEVKTENKPRIPDNLNVGLISPSVAQPPGHYPYAYPYLPHQNQFMSPRQPLSSSNAPSLPKNPSPPMQIIGPAPPAHSGIPMFPNRYTSSTVNNGPGLQASPVKSPSSSISGRVSPGRSLPTPPAAHTGPVKPPVASHPLHSPLSCISGSQQSLPHHNIHHHPISHSASPNCPPSQPPTTQALPPTVPPSHSGFNTVSGFSVHDLEEHDEDDESSPNREPSPLPKIEDSECHRSQSAIFLRHWNRGENHSCSRTDLTFKPVPDSQLSRKREERIRRQAEKEREEKERIQKKATTPEKRVTPKPSPVMSESSNYSSVSMYDRLLPRASEIPISTMSRLGNLPPNALRPPSLGLPPTMSVAPSAASHLDPVMQHYNVAALYQLGTRERMELEREREIDRLKEEMLKQRSQIEVPAQYGIGLPAHLLGPRYGPPMQSAPHGSGFPPHGLYAHPAVSTASLYAAERDRHERMAAASLAYHASRPSLLRPPEPYQRLPHGFPPQSHAALLARPYEEQLVQFAAQEQMQRQILLERERLSQYNPQNHFRP